MTAPGQGYVFHSYGPERYVRYAVASVATLRRHDTARPVALYCPPAHRRTLEHHGVADWFARIEPLPEAHRSITGFKHHLHRFKPFERSLYVDADMIWCRNPDPLWQMLDAYSFTATGRKQADFFFGGPKSTAVVFDILLDRRRRTLEQFDLTYLPRVQAGMIYAHDQTTTRDVCEHAAHFLRRSDETHFRSRLNDDGRTEETCEWSLAMAMSHLALPILPWWQGHYSPQLDYITGMTEHDEDFRTVRCRYYLSDFVYTLRGLETSWLRDALIQMATRLPGCGDYMDVTPFTVHFGWLHHKAPFHRFTERLWRHIVDGPSNDPAALPNAEPATSA